MITQDTAVLIWSCYREIEAAKQLLADMEKVEAKSKRDHHAPHIRDTFGRRRRLELGVPSGENSHRLFDVSSRLAESVIRAHIAEKKAELAVANEQARVELDAETQPVPQVEPNTKEGD